MCLLFAVMATVRKRAEEIQCLACRILLQPAVGLRLLDNPLQACKHNFDDADALTIQRVGFPSEGGLVVPAVLVRRSSAVGRLRVIIMYWPAAKEALV